MKLFGNFKLHYWPGITSAWFLLTFILCYAVSVSNNHVKAFFPYISDTGAVPPESCILGQMMNIGAVLMGITMYIRYRQVDFIAKSNDLLEVYKWNNAALWLGNIMSLGVSVVGNFQKPAIGSIHFLGAFMAFGIGLIFFIVQTKMTRMLQHVYDNNPQYGIGRGLLYFRVFLVVSHFICFMVVAVCGTISFMKNEIGDVSWWTPDREAYDIHLAAVFAEWIMFGVFVFYTLTGALEFKQLEFEDITFSQRNYKLSGVIHKQI